MVDVLDAEESLSKDTVVTEHFGDAATIQIANSQNRLFQKRLDK